MRFKKIIFIRYLHLTEKTYTDFFMSDLISNGFQLEYWDISTLIFKNDYNQEDSSALLTVRKFQTYKELSQAIRMEKQYDKPDTTLFIPLMYFDQLVSKVFRYLTIYHCPVIGFGRDMYAVPPTPLIKDKIRHITFTRVLNKVKRIKLKQWINWGLIKTYSTCFVSGSQGFRALGVLSSQSISQLKAIPINCSDYDTSLSIRQQGRLIEVPYILFLDTYLPFHPDFKLLSLKTLPPDEYYPIMNCFFDRLEQQTGFPVVIAAHPKALKYKEFNYYNGRSVFFNDTARLSKDAECVLAQFSTSINFAIAFEKPMLFVTSHALEAKMPSFHREVTYRAAYLGCRCVYADSEEQPPFPLKIDTQKYNQYKYEYLTSPSIENTYSKDIVIKFLKNTK